MPILITILGIIIGSFLNVCIYRIPRQKSISYPPSKCSSCGEELKPWDLIPILSYIFLRGRCRQCNDKISLQYPIVEVLNGLLYLSIYLKLGLSVLSIMYMLISSILIVISFIDYRYQIIPDKILIVGFIIVSLTHLLYNFPTSLLNGLLGLLIGGGLFLLIAIASKGGMGGGDIKLIALLGYIFGLKVFMVMILSFILGAIISLILLATKIKSRKDAIPFGPFLAIAGLIVMLFSEEILNIYLKIIF
ncbi:prepilin peptidase [Clostridium sp. D2Q-11]|uniref:Prepilin peptidase n=1 Tax=Anaeromonas frigoriresistens TaxID=2683708 RepID=A0A942UZR1_9FIRM|nr:A24 family peptidase [Anaeromonas frigoriresistens]MBS4540011.1 prepilin peptidase [Anaeromonas frigoriresistens]